MASIEKHYINDIKIFLQFFNASPYKKNTLLSIDIPNSKEPSLICKLSNGKKIAFEILECIDKNLMQSIYRFYTINSAFQRAIENLPKKEKKIFKSKFKGSLFKINLKKDISLKKQLNLVESIIDIARTKKVEEITRDIRKKFGKSYHLNLKTNRRDSMKMEVINLGLSGGPSLHMVEKLWQYNPIKKQFNKTLKKIYDKKKKVELLAYYEIPNDLPPFLPVEYWVLPYMDDVNFKKSFIKRVWVFSLTNDEIVYVGPEI